MKKASTAVECPPAPGRCINRSLIPFGSYSDKLVSLSRRNKKAFYCSSNSINTRAPSPSLFPSQTSLSSAPLHHTFPFFPLLPWPMKDAANVGLIGSLAAPRTIYLTPFRRRIVQVRTTPLIPVARLSRWRRIV